MQRFKNRHGRMKPALVLVNDEPENRRYSHHANHVVASTSVSPQTLILHSRSWLRVATMRYVQSRMMHRVRILLLVLLVARYGASIYGTITCLVKLVDMSRNFAFGCQMVLCALFGFLCATYCMYVNDDLHALLSSSFYRANDALDESGIMSRSYAVLGAMVEMLVGIAVQMQDTGNYRILREIESTWSVLHMLRYAIRTVARGELKTLTRSMLSWIETNTQLLLHIRNAWNALSDVVADVIHDAADALQNITQSLAVQLTCSWKMLTNWVQQVTHNAISNDMTQWNDVHRLAA